MSENAPSRNQKQASASTEDVGQKDVQATFDEANAKGYFGTTPDETPNEDYTVAGVTKKARGSK